MITVITLTGVGIGAALAIDAAALVLVADVRLAMKRADLSLDFVSRVTGIPPQRLSDQLNGKTPFTGFWRFATREMRETDFWTEFIEIQADRVNRVVVRADVGALISKLDSLVGPKPMAKADLPVQQKRQAS